MCSFELLQKISAQLVDWCWRYNQLRDWRILIQSIVINFDHRWHSTELYIWIYTVYQLSSLSNQLCYTFPKSYMYTLVYFGPFKNHFKSSKTLTWTLIYRYQIDVCLFTAMGFTHCRWYGVAQWSFLTAQSSSYRMACHGPLDSWG